MKSFEEMLQCKASMSEARISSLMSNQYYTYVFNKIEEKLTSAIEENPFEDTYKIDITSEMQFLASSVNSRPFARPSPLDRMLFDEEGAFKRIIACLEANGYRAVPSHEAQRDGGPHPVIHFIFPKQTQKKEE